MVRKIVSRVVMPTESPEWWVHRLWIELQIRERYIRKYDNYYTGEHPLPWLSPKAAEEFREILRMSRSNYMGLVVDAQTERMMVDGFRLGTPSKRPAGMPLMHDLIPKQRTSPDGKSPGAKSDDPLEADQDTWRIWQANDLDSEFDKSLLEAAITGMGYLLVAPNEDDPATPLMYVEHPSQAIVEYVPGTSRRRIAAGLKVYDDDWTGTVHAVLYLPDGIYKYKQDRPKTATPNVPLTDQAHILRLGGLVQPQWFRREVAGESWPAPNPAGEVTLYELPNNPRLLTGGRSELHDLTDIQDRVNKTIADRILTQDYGAFPQKWVAGWPTEDEAGRPQPEIETGRNRIVSTSIAETQFGQWQAAPLDPYSAAKREDVKDIASRSRTPAQYLLGEMSNVNGQTLKASESGLVAKCRQRMRNIDTPLERAMIAARKMAGLPVPQGMVIETIWRNPEHRTEGELVDALTKMATLGVPQEVLWERWGATPTEIQRWKQLQDEASARAQAADPTTILAARFRTLAGTAVPIQGPPDVGAGTSGANGGPLPKSATNNSGSGKPGQPGVPGKPGRPGINGRPGKPGGGRTPGQTGAKANA